MFFVFIRITSLMIVGYKSAIIHYRDDSIEKKSYRKSASYNPLLR